MALEKTKNVHFHQKGITIFVILQLITSVLKDVSFALNRVPPPISLRLLLGVPPSLPLQGDVFNGWSLIEI